MDDVDPEWPKILWLGDLGELIVTQDPDAHFGCVFKVHDVDEYVQSPSWMHRYLQIVEHVGQHMAYARRRPDRVKVDFSALQRDPLP